MLTRSVLSVLTMASLLTAQSSTVVPPTATHSEGTTLTPGPGARDARVQYVIDAIHFGQPATITSLAFRRDGSFDSAFAGGAARATILISEGGRIANDVSPAFEANHGQNVVTVFDGDFLLPASRSPIGRAVDWNSFEDVVEFVFDSPFVHNGGNLCIEVRAQRAPIGGASVWSVDAMSDAVTGLVTQIGDSCSPHRARTSDGRFASARVGRQDLVPGATPSFVGYGTAGTTSAFMLGFVPLDIDLSVVGLAPAGCTLRVDPVITVLDTFAGDTIHGAVSRVRIQIPNQPSVFGTVLHAQFVEFSQPMYLSEGLMCQIAGAPSTLCMATIFESWPASSPLPATGRVWPGEAPVIRFGRL